MAGQAYGIHSLEHLKESLEIFGDRHPFYCMLLYAPQDGVDARLHRYVRTQWRFLDALTGPNLGFFVLEDLDMNRSIEAFRPEDVYSIARHLGVLVNDLPCLLFFTDPINRNETRIVKLRDLLPEPEAIADENLTELFREISAIVDSCSGEPIDRRLECLEEGLAKEWPGQPRGAATASRVSGWIVASSVAAGTIFQSLAPIIRTLPGVPG